MAKTPVYEADSVQELIGKLKSGEIPGSYVVQGLGGVGKGGKIRAVSAAKSSLGAAGKAQFDQEQRRQKQNKKEAADLSETAKQAAVAKIAKQAEENKAGTTLQSKANTTAEEARKRQAKQWEAFAQGVKTSWAKGTLPKGFEKSVPSEVGTTNLKESAKPEQETVKVSGTDKPIQYPTDVPEDIRAAAMAEYQRTGQNPPLTTEKVAQLQDQIDTTVRKLAAAKVTKGSGGSFNPFEPGDWVDVGAQAVTGGLEVAAKPLELIGRPGSAITGGLNAIVTNLKNQGAEMLKQRTFTPDVDLPEGSKGITEDIDKAMKDAITGKAKVSGSEFLQNLGLPDIPVVTPVAGMAWDVGIDPTTYVGLGTMRNVAKGIETGAAARAAIDVNNSAIKQAVKTAGQKGVTGLAERKAKVVAKKLTKGGGVIGGQTTAHEQLANDLVQKALAMGMSPGKAYAGARVAIEREIIGDAAKQKLATLAEKGLRDNKRILALRVGTKNIPIGKVPLIDLPYRGARALKGKAADTGLGQELAKMFSSKYWFPGETATLFNKANSLGVHAFAAKQKEILEAFKGYSGADLKRMADEHELGGDLAGQLGKKGKDLGPGQKFFNQIMDETYDERAKILGKEGDKVGNFVPHHYRGGSPTKIKDIKKVRKARFEDGAVGADRLTLQEAEDLKLRPIRRADEIAIAHVADHQRQMIKAMFDQKLIGSYGHVLDDPVLAQKLGLVAVTPPKAMRMKAGHKLYMAEDVKKVYQGVREFMGQTSEETNRIARYFDKGMRGWKMGATTLRPGHHVRNALGDAYLNYLDGVRNPYRYAQGAKMVRGNRAGLRIRVGNQVLDGDDVERLLAGSGANQGFISAERVESRIPGLKHVQDFAQGREMVGRYAHFIDTLIKEGKKANLGANNKAGLWKIATEAGRRINKYNINYGDLTPFERNTMKRIMPFYTWTRKAMPLMVESMFTRPGRMQAAPRMNRLISELTGHDPDETGGIEYPEWLKDVGFSRISDGEEPNVWSLPLPSQDFGNWFGGGTPDTVLKEALGNVNPLAQLWIERATGKNLFTGGKISDNELMYAGNKFGIAKNIMDIVGVGDKPLMDRLNAGLGIGTRQITENAQLSELRRQQDSLDAQMAQVNEDLGDYEVHKLKYGYSVYNKKYKITEKDGFSSPEDALIHAIALSNKAKGK